MTLTNNLNQGDSMVPPTIRSLFLAFLAAVLGVVTTQAMAGRYELIKTEIPDESYSYAATPANDAVCEAYEKNLNSFADEPYGMACGRKLNPAFGFTPVPWKKLDLVQHADLVQELGQFRKLPPFSGHHYDPKRLVEVIKEEEAKGLTLEVAPVKFGEHGESYLIARFGPQVKCDPRRRLDFNIPFSKAILLLDTSYRLLKTESDRLQLSGDNVFLFQGNVYSDWFEGKIPSPRNGASPEFSSVKFISKRPPYAAVVYLFSLESLGTHQISRVSVIRVCRFHYFDPNLTFAPENN